jgi:hypothetical protein
MRTFLVFASGVACIVVACSSSDAAPGGANGDGSSGANGGDGGGPGGSNPGTPSSSGGVEGGGGGESGAPVPVIGGLFQQPEPWTTNVSALTKSGRSDAIIAALGSFGGWGNGNKFQIDFSIPLFFANASTPRQTITGHPGDDYCYGGPDCQAVPMQMPLPTNGNAEGSSDYTCDTTYSNPDQGDCHILVVEKDEKKLYELYNATKVSGGYNALAGFIWDLTKAYPANLRGDQCTSADAGGFPIAGLLPTADEVASGEVKHALRFILPNSRMKKDAYVHPASHAGGPTSTNPNAPPYGVRFRLKATFDETPYNASEKVILKALKTYGMLLSDGGVIALTFADDRLSTAKWSTLGITASSFNSVGVDSFDVVDLGPEIAVTNDCVLNP